MDKRGGGGQKRKKTGRNTVTMYKKGPKIKRTRQTKKNQNEHKINRNQIGSDLRGRKGVLFPPTKGKLANGKDMGSSCLGFFRHSHTGHLLLLTRIWLPGRPLAGSLHSPEQV